MLSIQTKTLLLRPWQPEDIPALAAEANNIRVSGNLRDSFPYPYTEEDAEAFIRYACAKPSPQEFAIVIDGKAVGGIGLVPLTDIERFSAEIGYWTGEAWWNRGVATEAVRTFADYLLAHTNFVRLFACVFDYNLPSAHVLEKAGFRRVGVLQKAAFKNNRFVDMFYYERIG
jgi:RimJ/RimL family protein N-acetyltransferase